MRKYISLLALIIIFSAGCEKSNNSDGNKMVTGNVTLDVDVMHHSWGVPTIKVYVKNQTTHWPGRDSTLYDLNKTSDHNGSLSFQNLGAGNYVFYASGYDSIFQSWVIGYQSLTLTNADAGQELYLKIPVSEIF